LLDDALDLIDRHRRPERRDEPRRVSGRSGADRPVVERQDLAACSFSGRDLLEQRALADLAGAEHDDNASIGQRRLDGTLRVSGDESRWRHPRSLTGDSDTSTTKAPRNHHHNSDRSTVTRR